MLAPLAAKNRLSGDTASNGDHGNTVSLLAGPPLCPSVNGLAETPAAADVVREDRAVETRRVERLAVRAEVGAEDATRMPRQALDRLTTVGIPDDRDPIVAGADGELASRARTRSAAPHAECAPRPSTVLPFPDVPEMHGAVIEARRPVSGRRG